MPGVITVERFLHWWQVASRDSRYHSFGVLFTIALSFRQEGQVNRMTYPVLVPLTSCF
jgi:hypothetical protein